MQVIGIHQRAGDLAVNACKKKAATNIRRYFPTASQNLNRAYVASPGFRVTSHTLWLRLLHDDRNLSNETSG